jgi:putative Mg2+ transporter-C (MgtC) family protein
VALGSCLVMLVSVAMASLHLPGADPRILQIDPSRIAYGVMTGIGFLGAGTIVQNRSGVHGLTTAAGIWCVAAIGLAVGAGLYVVSIGATLLVLVVLWMLDFAERLLPQQRYRLVCFELPHHHAGKLGIDPAEPFRAILDRSGVKLTDAGGEFDRRADRWTVSLRLVYRRDGQITRLLAEIARDRPDACLTASKDV